MKGIQVSRPRFEHHHSGLGVNTSIPRISWTFKQQNAECNDWRQTSYDVEIIFGSRGTESQSFSAVSNSSVCVPWPARPLKSREEAKVRVRCRGGPFIALHNDDAGSKTTEWSPWSMVEAALLESADWKARWIAPFNQDRNEDQSLRPIRLAGKFTLDSQKPLLKARLYITSHGCYEAQINGSRVGDQFMAPGWQSYQHRLHYQVFDVTELLLDHATNSIDVTVGPGWYASALAWAGGRRCCFGDRLALLAQLFIEYEDGNEQIFATDGCWNVLKSPIVSSEIYKGETYDMGSFHEVQELLHADSVTVVQEGLGTAQLISPDTPPVRTTEELRPIRLFRSKSGKQLVDFGQNLVGRLRIVSLRKSAGTRVSLSHAEVLENDELGRRPLRHAASTDTVICDGAELTQWTPKFTFHGFRYAEITGWNDDDKQCPLTLDSLVAEVLHSDMRRTGWFECSHPMVNKLHENARWGMRGNFLSVPTDCPQRDERLGWTGDIQVFAPSANFLYDTTGMLNNWLDDLAAEQLSPDHNGVPPFVVPDVISKAHERDDDFWPKLPNAVWDDVAILLPWALWRQSGDPKTLAKQYVSMRTWLDVGVRRGPDRLWDPELYQLGDWLDPLAPPSEPGNGRTNGTVVADAYLVHVTKRMAECARLLSRHEDYSRYDSDYQSLLARFHAKYITKAGFVASDTQTALALTIKFGILSDPEQLRTAGERLAQLVRLQQFRVATGFAGTPVILHALTMTGHSDLAYRMLLEQRCPSWMYGVSMGATTVWERWDSMLPDGSINPGEMTSFNHFAMASGCINWLHEVVGGISSLEAGWRTILVKPVPGGEFTWAKAQHESPYGLIQSDWSIEGDFFKLSLLVPPNTRARVILPSTPSEPNGIKESLTAKSGEKWVGSGRHSFRCEYKAGAWPPQAIMPPFWPQPQPVCA